MTRITRPLSEARLGDNEPIFAFPANQGSRVTISTASAPHGRSRSAPYPIAVYLHVRLGDERVYATYDMMWEDVERLHGFIGNALKNRKRFVVAIRKANEANRRKTGRE